MTPVATRRSTGPTSHLRELEGPTERPLGGVRQSDKIPTWAKPASTSNICSKIYGTRTPDRSRRRSSPRSSRTLERDLERVLEHLTDDFPLLRSLVDRRAGGQKRLPMPGKGDERVHAPLIASVPAGHESGDLGNGSLSAESAAGQPRQGASSPQPESPTPSPLEAPPSGDQVPPARESPAPGDGQSHADVAAAAGTLDTIVGRRRPARCGLLVRFESRPEDLELARLVDATIWINDAHPAFSRAVASRSLGYHTALAVALALAPLAVEARDEHTFITHFLAHWAAHRPQIDRPGAAGEKDRADETDAQTNSNAIFQASLFRASSRTVRLARAAA
jgi:hypothetical protein